MSDSYAICVRVEDIYTDLTPTIRLREAIAHTLRQHNIEDRTGLTLLVTCDEQVQRLNKQYRGIDAPTDVLSFPSGDSLPDMDIAPYLGDILIAYPYTAAQAAQEGHALDDVLVLLAVHGTLHLLGFDHDTPANQAAMWAAQETILAALGVPKNVIPAIAAARKEDAGE